MTPFEQVIARTERWLESLDRERDAAARAMLSRPSQEIASWIDRMDAERRDVVDLLVELRRLQARNVPALLFAIRPRRQLKAGLTAPKRSEGVA